MPNGITVGAIRWDAWWAQTGPAEYTRATLSPQEYQWRAPAHSQILAPNVIKFETTQAKFDNEITFASSKGLHYWAYLLYGEGSTMNAGLDFHLSSSIAANMKFSLMMATNVMGSTGNYQSIINNLITKYISKSYYFKLPHNNKPLIYLYYSSGDITGYWSGNIANLKTSVDYLRSQMIAGGYGDPHICLMTGGGTTAETVRVQLGANSISSYISRIPDGLNKTFVSLDNEAQLYWIELRDATASEAIPICMMGWNHEPRRIRPVSWEVASVRPGLSTRTNHIHATNAELQNHVQAAINFINNNPVKCDPKTILCYAWNENDEGGWLNQTLGDPTGARLNSLTSIIS